jgi:membrane protein implicated in regulation of membrane protease activity
MSMVWLIAAIVFAVGEGLTVGLTSVWFALGSLAALLTSGLGGTLWLQLVVFCIVSFVTLALVRPIARKYFTPKVVPTNADRNIGQEGVVTETIDNLKASGQATVGGVVWTARSEEDTPIPKGAKVRVQRIEGVKLIVSPIAEESKHI